MKISFAATEKGERMMATCKDCIYMHMCYWIEHYGTDAEKEISCRYFKNKADYAEVKHGEWIDKRWTTECDWCDMTHHSITCSVCKEETYGGIKTKYCPDCGAKMDGKKGK
jgi:hypothetical protein